MATQDQLENKGWELSPTEGVLTWKINDEQIPANGCCSNGNTKGRFSKYHPYEFLYSEYEKELPQELFYMDQEEARKYNRPVSVFKESVRLKLIYYFLKASSVEGGCDIQLTQLLHNNSILAFYPLHNRTLAAEIHDQIDGILVSPMRFPFDSLKEYFGEKVTLFFVYIGHYSEFLFWPGIIGIAFQIVVWAKWGGIHTEGFSHPVLPFYGIVITVWSIFMLEYWKRKQIKYALKWGMIGFEASEPERPEFKGEMIISYVDGKKMLYFPKGAQAHRKSWSFTAIYTFIFLVIGVVAGIYYMRYTLQPKIGSYASTVASILNAVQIQVFNMIYQFMANKLTAAENHKTDTAFEDSMITKTFLFQFINSYSSFFFLAFIASYLDKPDGVPSSYVGECGSSTCMEPLAINLAILFATRLFLTNTIDALLPYYNSYAKKKAETKGIVIPPGSKVEDVLTPPENDYILQEFNPMQDSIEVWADTTVQFGFMTMFITALPISVMFTYINNHIKMKLYGWKLLTMFQRPVPLGAEDIGSWQDIMTLLSIASVITNAALICFTMNVIWFLKVQGRIWIFIGFQWTLFFFQYVMSVLVPDVPEEVDIQMQRMAFIISKVCKKEPDEDYVTLKNDPDRFTVPDQEFTVDCCGRQGPPKYKSKVPKMKDTGRPEPPRLPYPAENDFLVARPYPHDVSTYLFPNPVTKVNIETLRSTLKDAGLFGPLPGATGATGGFNSYGDSAIEYSNATMVTSVPATGMEMSAVNSAPAGGYYAAVPSPSSAY